MYSKWIRKFYEDDEALKNHLRKVAQDLLEEGWRIRDQERPNGIQVVRPEEVRRWRKEGPCPGCPCEPWCDRICSLRARWWDDFRRGVLGK